METPVHTLPPFPAMRLQEHIWTREEEEAKGHIPAKLVDDKSSCGIFGFQV
jgi:hypothetical protein